MKNRFLICLLSASLLLSACAKLKLTVRNDRATPVKNVEVKSAGNPTYVLPSLEPGASDSRELKVDADGTLAVNFSTPEGGLYYTASNVKLKKGEGHNLLLKLNEKGLLDTEEIK